jgi:hypothetical protein
MADLQAEYIAGTAAVGPTEANPNFVGNTLMLSPYYPNFRTARSYQMNIGIQRQLAKGGVLTVDYLRDISLHFQFGEDVSHVGDSRFLELNAALNAIAGTEANNAPSWPPAGGVTQANASTTVACYITALANTQTPASINEFANNGLDNGGVYYGGFSAPFFGLTPDTGAAFGGIHPTWGV